jgi:DNA-binding NarL/FixJ family response regulator
MISPEGLNEQMRMEADETAPVRIWLVDDNVEFRRLLGKLLAHEAGFECARQFSSAEALLETLAKEPAPDVIITDIEMSGQSGVDALHPVKKLAPATHVLILTTFNDPHCRARALQEGAAVFLLKSQAIHVPEHIRRLVEQGAPDGGAPGFEKTRERVQEFLTPTDRRAPEPKHGRHTKGTRLQPDQGCRHASWRASSPLVRGVHYLQAIFGLRRRQRRPNAVEIPNADESTSQSLAS